MRGVLIYLSHGYLSRALHQPHNRTINIYTLYWSYHHLVEYLGCPLTLAHWLVTMEPHHRYVPLGTYNEHPRGLKNTTKIIHILVNISNIRKVNHILTVLLIRSSNIP